MLVSNPRTVFARFITITRFITQSDFDKSFRLGIAEGRGGFSACARACAHDADSRFAAALQDVLVPGLPELDGAHTHGGSHVLACAIGMGRLSVRCTF